MAKMVSSIAHGSALPLISEPTDYFKELITDWSKVPRRRGGNTQQKPGIGAIRRRIPGRKRRWSHAERRDLACDGHVRCFPRQFQQHGQAGRSKAIGADARLKTIQQRLPLRGIDSFGAPEMAHIVALTHELGSRELHHGDRWRREACCHLREPRDQFDRRDQKAEPNSRADRLAE